MSGRGATGVAPSTNVARRLRVLAAAFILALLPALSGIAPTNAAVVADYPTWEEVVAAKRNEAQAKALSASLQSQLQGLQDEAQRTQDEADAKGALYAEAQDAYDKQNIETQSLVAQTEQAQTDADEAYAVAAQVIAEMSKSGRGGDLTPQLFTTPGSPDVLLDRLEISRVIGDRYADLYEKAIELRNRANALADQAEVAQGILEELRIKAEAAFQVAQEAALAAAAKLEQTQRDIAEVRQRIDYLAGISAETTAQYSAGIKAQFGENAGGQISATGWARPLSGGYITSNYGWRIDPINHSQAWHTGTDLAGVGCGATIYAAHGGTVTYAGWYGSWGYYVAIDHGDGTGTGYAHIQPGGIGVGIGQDVDPGQPIAKVGTTGYSTGCHLHFMVRVNGNRDTTDPVQYLRGQGISLG
ncbi:peptidoglycan DD-metalloendopeptidase family protein [Pseudolysinimonas sp.]|jgi:murein DD-endopeptidase MepM/ murein hydrolase activator NlpD|uniref:peptidoglycan DD-metalloendopeptidase family protein n=1 Tax=Pseudolysinimonas sp. TaxID=2680009 RepID=UPI00378372D8